MTSILITILLLACGSPKENNPGTENLSSESIFQSYADLDTATFAGGCFWCIEAAFEQIKGVEEAVSGYSGGQEKNPTYKEVSYGRTDHAEAVQIYFDPEVVSYETLLDIFFVAHDPTQLNRQGPDVGEQYRSAIFYHDDQQKQWVDQKIAQLEKDEVYSRPIVTQVVPYDKFWMAEAYHQDYEEHHPNDRYIQNVSRPKINKVRRTFKDLLKS
jgi:peptide-methionine (S)-S-oxide reductase